MLVNYSRITVTHADMAAVTPFADGAAYLAAIDKDAISAFVFETGSVKANGNLQEFTTVDATNTTFVVSASTGFALQLMVKFIITRKVKLIHSMLVIMKMVMT